MLARRGQVWLVRNVFYKAIAALLDFPLRQRCGGSEVPLVSAASVSRELLNPNHRN
jgi:hypothetical protein